MRKKPKDDTLLYLEKKCENEMEQKREELAVRREEMAIERRKIELDENKQELERKERESRMALEAEERRIMMNVLKKQLGL